MANEFEAGGLTPSETLIARIQNRRGNRVNLPQPLAPGEFGWCIDTRELFLGLNDESALAAIELFSTGNINGARAQTNDTINTRVIEYWSKWSALNNTITLPSGVVTSEAALLSDVASISSSEHIAPQNLADVESIESNIAIVNALNIAARDSVPVNFTSQVSINYEVEVSEATSATAIITAPAGIITDIDVQTGGLGYLEGETVTITDGSGTSAEFTVQLSGDGQGIIPDGNVGLTTVNPGTGYTNGATITLSLPNRDALTTATAVVDSLTFGGIDSITVDFGGLSYVADPTKIPEVEIIDDFGYGAVATVDVSKIDPVTGELYADAIIVSNSGQNYVAPIVQISAPKTNAFYKFRYNIGVEDASAAIYDDAALIVTINALNAYADPLYSGLLLDVVEHPAASAVGQSGVVASLAYQMTDTTINFQSTREAANVASLVNILNPAFATGLVVTKQNVEILTEFSTASGGGGGGIVASNGDTYYTDLIPLNLAPSASFIDTGISWPIGDSDISQVEYSAVLNDFLVAQNSFAEAGTMTIVSNALVNDASLSLTSAEVRGSNLVLGTPAIAFKAIVDGTFVKIQYRHDFAANIVFKLKTNRWLSS